MSRLVRPETIKATTINSLAWEIYKQHKARSSHKFQNKKKEIEWIIGRTFDEICIILAKEQEIKLPKLFAIRLWIENNRSKMKIAFPGPGRAYGLRALIRYYNDQRNALGDADELDLKRKI